MALERAILVLNAGSSSLKYAIYNFHKEGAIKRTVQGLVEQIGTSRSSISHHSLTGAPVPGADAAGSVKLAIELSNHKAALQKATEYMHYEQKLHIAGVGHRVVHGGESLTTSSLINKRVKDLIHQSSPLAPLHNPPNLVGIDVAEQLFPVPQVAVFDTSFHSTMPEEAYTYGLPYGLYKDLGIRRYGFHGTSYLYLTRETARLLNKPPEKLNAIVFHLGAGASVAAIKGGKSFDTSMGVTPLEGLVMATRCGDVDPSLVKILKDQKGLSQDDVDTLMNKKSGLLGLTGTSDMRTVVDRAASGDTQAELGLKVWIHRARKYLGAYLVHLRGDVDALVFSAGIGERSVVVRRLICEGLEQFGIEIDEAKNDAVGKKRGEIQKEGSRMKILVVPTDEELCIAQETIRVIDTAE